MRFCFIILCHLYLLSRLAFSRVIHSECIFHSTAVLFPLYFKVNALPMSLNLNAALSSFIAASPRIIHHSKTRHWKKKKKKTSTDLSRNQNTICVNPVFTGRFVYGPTNTWMGHICFYLFNYLLCATHRPLSLPQPPPHQCCAGAGSDHEFVVLSESKTYSVNSIVWFTNNWLLWGGSFNKLLIKTAVFLLSIKTHFSDLITNGQS